MSTPTQSSRSSGSQSWSATISDYILKRRAQNLAAYTTAFAARSSRSNKEEQSDSIQSEWLFKALIIALAQQLDEGHTVLTLSANAAEPRSAKAGTWLGIADNLFLWQRQLLSILVTPLLKQVEEAEYALKDDKSEDQEVAEQKGAKTHQQWQLLGEQWERIKIQSTLSNYEKVILQQRYEASRAVLRLFKDINNDVLEAKNSLGKFFNYLKNHPLISLHTSNHKTPIKVHAQQLPQNLTITFWLHRTWHAEATLAQHISQISQYPVAKLPISLNSKLNNEQQSAIDMANKNAFSIITGGPGTGKTFTVAQLVIALQTADDQKASLALAAPTGKAAQRMQESLQAALNSAGVKLILQEAKTIHRLLGIGQGGQPRYHSQNPLSEDIIIIDEASMLGVELANHLVSAVKPGARLILLGDANQLAAVDAGAVLADLCRIPSLKLMHQQLIQSRRFDSMSGIGKLADQINNSHLQALELNMNEIWQLFQNDPALEFYSIASQADIAQNQKINSLSNYKSLSKIQSYYQNYLKITKSLLEKSQSAKSKPFILNENTIKKLFNTFNQFRILTAGHHGHWGDHYLNHQLSQWHINELKLPLSNHSWYHGRPIMILNNSYELEVFNGDIGICLQSEQGLQVFFENNPQGMAISLFSEEMVATAYAMTIHKSQGSEFDHVAISFDETNSRLLSKELIYTAVTRAKSQVTIFSSTDAFKTAISTPTVRQTGLALQFADTQAS